MTAVTPYGPGYAELQHCEQALRQNINHYGFGISLLEGTSGAIKACNHITNVLNHIAGVFRGQPIGMNAAVEDDWLMQMENLKSQMEAAAHNSGVASAQHKHAETALYQNMHDNIWEQAFNPPEANNNAAYRGDFNQRNHPLGQFPGNPNPGLAY